VKAKWIDEVTEILASDRFTAWFESLENARLTVKRMIDRSDELLTQVNLLEFRAELAHRKAIDTLERANALEDESAELANQAAELENASFEVVSQFEMQREVTTKLWETLGAIEGAIEDGSSDRARLEKRRIKAKEEYEREDKKKQLLWAEVEKLWIRSIDCNLALREKKQKAKLVRAEAENLFSRHTEEANEASKLRNEAAKVADAQAQAKATLVEAEESARRNFECLLTVDFMYWVARESNKMVYAVPLIEDAKHYVVPVSPGHIYRCSPTLGIDEMVLVDRESDLTPGQEPSGASGGHLKKPKNANEKPR
jgi:hypothetical protein